MATATSRDHGFAIFAIGRNGSPTPASRHEPGGSAAASARGDTADVHAKRTPGTVPPWPSSMVHHMLDCYVGGGARQRPILCDVRPELDDTSMSASGELSPGAPDMRPDWIWGTVQSDDPECRRICEGRACLHAAGRTVRTRARIPLPVRLAADRSRPRIVACQRLFRFRGSWHASA